MLEPEARERLSRLRLANPELAEKVEMLIIYMYQAGQVKTKISDAQLKALLQKLTGARHETKIRRV